MYGPAAPTATRTLLLRIVFASFPLWSVGLLTWVPSLRFALLRRRPRDWAVFALACALTAVYVLLLVFVPASEPGQEGNAQFFAGLYIVLLVCGAVVHAVLADRFPRTPRGAGAPHPPFPGTPSSPYGTPSSPYGASAPYAPTVAAGPAPPSRPVPPAAPLHPVHPAPPVAPAPAASPRMRQVASELDELGALLRGDQQAPGERPGDDPRRQPGPWGRA